MKLYQAKLVATTNSSFKMYCEQIGTLAVPPLGWSPRFRPDALRFEVLTMSMLNEVDEYPQYAGNGTEVLILELKTKNSVYKFEVMEELDES